jgi:hypothetical protein
MALTAMSQPMRKWVLFLLPKVPHSKTPTPFTPTPTLAPTANSHSMIRPWPRHCHHSVELTTFTFTICCVGVCGCLLHQTMARWMPFFHICKFDLSLHLDFRFLFFFFYDYFTFMPQLENIINLVSEIQKPITILHCLMMTPISKIKWIEARSLKWVEAHE